MPVTINDVAKEAGVSITTVSRVLNNNYPVKKDTREKIEKAIKELDYKPNIMARSLITKKTSVIGIIVPGITNLFFSTIVEDIERKIKNKGYSIVLSNTKGNEEEEKNMANDMICRLVDGIIVIDPSVENLNSGFFDDVCKRVPTIILNGRPRDTSCNFICYDETVGTKEAFQYLIELGHKKIAFVRGDKSLSYDIKEQVYKEFLSDNSLEYCKVLNVGAGNSIEVIEKTEEQLELLLKKIDKPTAFFACNDLMAVGVLNVCSKLNIKVPDEISIIGFDNTILTSLTHPKLTSVDQNMKKISEICATSLIELISKKNENRINITMDTNLIIRDSCSKV